MDSFELNKIIGAILGTLLFVMGVGFLAEAIYTPRVSSAQGYDLPEPSPAAAPATEAPAAVPLPQLLASANAKNGEAVARKCHACHTFEEGGPNKVGPDLYDVVGRKIASHGGYSYSDALKAHADDTWTYANLNEWLTSPSAWAPGTKMTFAGIPDDGDRADLLAYLQTLSHSPVPFPEPAPAGTEGGVTAPDKAAGTDASQPAAGQPAASAPEAGATAPQPATGASPADTTTETAPTPSAGATTTEAAPEAGDGASTSTSAQDQIAPAAGGEGAGASQ